MHRFINAIDRKHDSDIGLMAKREVRLALVGNDMDTPFEQRHAAVPRTSCIRLLEMIATEGNLWRRDSDTDGGVLARGSVNMGKRGSRFAFRPFT